MNQGSRTLLAVVLSIGVLFLYFNFIAPPPQPQPAPTSLAAQPSVAESPALAATNSTVVPGLQPNLTEPGLPGASTQTSFTNNGVAGQISELGALITSWKLQDYHQQAGEDSELIDLIKDNGGGMAFYLTLREQEVAQWEPYQLTVNEPTTRVYERQGDGIRVRKVFQFNPEQDPHLIDVIVEIENTATGDALLSPRLWLVRSQKEQPKKGFFSFLTGPPDLFLPAYFGDGSYEPETNWEKLGPATEKSGMISWAGLTDRYFLLSLISRQGSDSVSVRYGKRADQRLYTSLSYGSIVLRPGQAVSQRYSAYLGPKKREPLQLIGANLEASVDYGWFGFIAIPLLWLLIFFHKAIGNWGIAIIILTFFVKLLLHPINKKSMTSMKAMQKIQPQLKELREKYKNDKQRLNTEMMNLFKTHQVNPMGGCLPMVVQLPVYIGLYKVLWNAIELYHAPFFWIYSDLSAPDPLLISPVLLGIFMVLQQKLTPQATTMEPAQQKMMMFMPLMFAGFLIFFPFGLVLYIFVNTVMSVVQQYMIQHDMTFLDLFRKLTTKLKSRA